MSDIAGLLKTEIIRLSKKVIRQYVSPLQVATVSNKRQLSALSKQVEQLERELKKLRRVTASTTAAPAAAEAGNKVRFVAKGFRTLRARLGLSAREMGLLLGVSMKSVYDWESGNGTPRAEHVKTIAGLRGLGKREARERLKQLAAT